jgi:hypothetical protein
MKIGALEGSGAVQIYTKLSSLCRVVTLFAFV